MIFDNRTANREPQADPGRLGRKIWIKEALQHFGRNPGSGVLDGHDDELFVLPRTQSEFTRSTCGFLHGFDGIPHEVQQHLFDLYSVGPDAQEGTDDTDKDNVGNWNLDE